MKRIFHCFCNAYRRGRFLTLAGTASREEFWYYVLGHFLLSAVLIAGMTFLTKIDWELTLLSMVYLWDGLGVRTPDALFGMTLVAVFAVYAIFMVVSIIPGTTLAVRRYHDAGYSGRLFAALVVMLPVAYGYCIWQFWEVSANFYDAQLIDPDTLLDDGFSFVPYVLIMAHACAIANLVILALPGKHESLAAQENVHTTVI